MNTFIMIVSTILFTTTVFAASPDLVGSYKLQKLEEPGKDGKLKTADATGLLVLSPEGFMSVQVMYKEHSGSQYATGGYEATYGKYTKDSEGMFTYRPEASLVRNLIGKTLKRAYEFSGNNLIISSADKTEKWKVTWERQQPAISSSTEKKVVKVMTTAQLPANSGPEANFTGKVMVTPLVAPEAPSSLGAGSVTFQPGDRSAWHSHPKGQLLVVTDGEGLVQGWGEKIKTIKKGDVVWTPAGIKHWHGATPKTSVTHVAVQELVNGKPADWLEKVSDVQYKK